MSGATEICSSLQNYQTLAFRLAFSILHDEEEAADALQDATISAYLKFSTFRGISLRSWFLTIVRNRCYDALRHHMKNATTSLDYNYNTWAEDTIETTYLHDDMSLTPEQWVEQKETVTAICECVDQLPNEYRKVIVLVDIQGMDYAEAARVLGRPVGTIKSRLARGRAQVHRMLSMSSRGWGALSIQPTVA
jgi:RNA polymerase sigma-70 factor (ECF subfamily)